MRVLLLVVISSIALSLKSKGQYSENVFLLTPELRNQTSISGSVCVGDTLYLAVERCKKLLFQV